MVKSEPMGQFDTTTLVIGSLLAAFLAIASAFIPYLRALDVLLTRCVLSSASLRLPTDAVFLQYLASVFLLVRSKSSKGGSTILLVGPSDGGKTAIFSSVGGLADVCQ